MDKDTPNEQLELGPIIFAWSGVSLSMRAMVARRPGNAARHVSGFSTGPVGFSLRVPLTWQEGLIEPGAAMWDKAQGVVQAIWLTALGVGAVVMWRLVTMPRIGGRILREGLYIDWPGLAVLKFVAAVALTANFLVLLAHYLSGGKAKPPSPPDDSAPPTVRADGV